jgi:hypothetical protein
MRDGAIIHINNYSMYALDGVFKETKILASEITGLP